MPGDSSASLNPAALPVGTVIGSWRIVGWAGCGTHGAVYRAVHVDKEHSAPVALKLALLPRNPRFAREAELLSRTRGPSVPRLWEAGEWLHPRGDSFPFLVMEWIDGLPLYAWARQHTPSAQQVLRLLAQLARALQAVHSQDGLHRDVKGDNVLVRNSDSRAMLIDFGSGLFPEASSLTPPDFYPGTPAYRSPESALFELNSLRDRSARYRAGPADELYALGVTACRLLTGEYPQFPDPTQDEHGRWHMEAVQTPPSLLQVEPPLRELVLRMLSVNPEDRCSATQWAEDLEKVAQPPPERSPVPNRAPEILPPPPRPPAARPDSEVRTQPQWPWLALVASAVTILAWLAWPLVFQLWEKLSVTRALVSDSRQKDGGAAGLGEAAASTSMAEPPESALQQAMAEEALPEPVPGQLRPDANGHCPRKHQVPLNGGCWLPLELDSEACGALNSNGHNGHLFHGKCYVPALPLSREPPPTSHPSLKP